LILSNKFPDVQKKCTQKTCPKIKVKHPPRGCFTLTFGRIQQFSVWASKRRVRARRARTLRFEARKQPAKGGAGFQNENCWDGSKGYEKFPLYAV